MFQVPKALLPGTPRLQPWVSDDVKKRASAPGVCFRLLGPLLAIIDQHTTFNDPKPPRDVQLYRTLARILSVISPRPTHEKVCGEPLAKTRPQAISPLEIHTYETAKKRHAFQTTSYHFSSLEVRPLKPPLPLSALSAFSPQSFACPLKRKSLAPSRGIELSG